MLTGHKSRILRFTAAAAAAVLVAGIVAPSASAEPDPTVDDVSERVERLYHEAEQAIERYNSIKEEVAAARTDLSSTRADVRAQRRETGQLRGQVEQLVLAQVDGTGGVDTTARMLSSEDPDAFVASMIAMRSYSDHTADLLTSYENARARLDLRVQQARDQVAEIRAAKKRAAAEKATTNDKAQAAEDLLDQLEKEKRQRIEERQARQTARAERIAERAAQRAEVETARQERVAARAESQVSRDADRSQTAAEEPDPAPADEPEPAPADEPAESPAPSGNGGGAVGTVLAQVGDAYVWGAQGPDAFDCSGLTMYAWAAGGVSLPHSAAMQATMGVPVTRDSLQPGDLVFYYSPISHVGMYVGNGQLVHAANPSAPVNVTSVDSMPIAAMRRVG